MKLLKQKYKLIGLKFKFIHIMASALQETLRSQPTRRPKPHKCTATQGKVYIGNTNPFTPSTNDYAKVAKHYEINQNNHYAFNGRNLSDNQPVTQFQNLKLQGGKKSEVLQK